MRSTTKICLLIYLFQLGDSFNPNLPPRKAFQGKLDDNAWIAPPRLTESGSSQLQDSPRLFNSLPSNNNNKDEDEDEKEYQEKLRKAEAAIAAAEEARRKLLTKNKSIARPLPPPNSLARLEYSDAGSLTISIPSKGFGSDNLFAGAFSIAWFSAIAPATLATGGASLLFLLPFWAAGGLVAKNAVFDPFVSGTLTIGNFAWALENRYAGRTISSKEGATEQLRGANAEVVAIVNGKPQGEVQLFSDKGISSFGLGLSIEELEYLAGEINYHISIVRDKVDTDSQALPF